MCWKNAENMNALVPKFLTEIDQCEDTHSCTNTHTHKKKKKRDRGREKERAVNSLLWCILKPHKMASNQGRDMLRREEVFSVWFTLKPSLIPVWWLPWVFAVPDLTPIPLTQSNFWALFELPRASYLITNREREEGSSTRTWPLETHILGQSWLSKPVLLGSPEIIKRRVDERGWSRTEKTKEKKYIKPQCAFQSSKDGSKLLLSKCVLLQFSSCIASKQSDYLVTNRVTKWRCYSQLTVRQWELLERWLPHSKWEFESLSVSSTTAVISNDFIFYCTSYEHCLQLWETICFTPTWETYSRV